MAMTHDYLDQLDQNVGIAPANSQEEYQAAQTIADIMRRHGVEPSIEEFDAKAFGGVMDQIMFATWAMTLWRSSAPPRAARTS